MIPPTLTTERLRIEPMALSHWEAYAAAWADPRMTEFIGGEPRSRNTSWGKFLGGIGLWTLLGYGYWSFVERATGAFVGNGGLASFERGLSELVDYPEAGWAFVPDAWNKGYATEAMTAILNWADEERNWARYGASLTGAMPPRTRSRPNWVSSNLPNQPMLSVTCSFTAANRVQTRDKLCITQRLALPLACQAAKRHS